MEGRKERIWELDALRGICIIGMLLIHLAYDLNTFGGIKFTWPKWADFAREYGYILFVLISGACASLSSKSFKRGISVFGAGLIITYVTTYIDNVFENSGSDSLAIWFGILHMIGICMMLYPIFRKLPYWALILFGVSFILLGICFRNITVSTDLFFPVGIYKSSMHTGLDFFPLFPGVGWFLLGAGIGKPLYKNKVSLFPDVNSNNAFISFLCYVGRNSLLIYLLHQPLFIAIVIFICKLI